MISKSRLKQIKGLHTTRSRKEESLFLAEGEKTVLELLNNRAAQIEEVFAVSEFIEANFQLLKSSQVLFSEIKESDLERISTLKTPNKTLAVCHVFTEKDFQRTEKEYLSLYLDEIKDPGNFGTILRLADWFGIHRVYASQGSCDLYNPKVIQSTMGAFMRVHVVYSELKDVIKNNSFSNVYGAVLEGNSLYAEKLKEGLLVIGNESSGISSENLNLIPNKITIPSHSESGTESLNAAMATSIIVSEFYRQLLVK